MTKTYIYTEKYPLKSFMNRYGTVSQTVVHNYEGIYIGVCVFSKDNERIIATFDSEDQTLGYWKDNIDNCYIYHIENGRYIISTHTKNYIDIADNPIVLYDDYKYKIIPRKEALKSKHYHEDAFFSGVLEKTKQIEKNYIELVTKQQKEEINSSFCCALCGKKFNNLLKETIWCATPYGKNHETYKVLACPECIKKASGADKYKYLTSNIMLWGIALTALGISLYVTFLVLQLQTIAALVSSAIAVFLSVMIFQDAVENKYAERLLRLIGFNNFVNKNEAKARFALVDTREMYPPAIDNEEYHKLQSLSDEVICLISDVCVHYSIFHQAEYFYGKRLIDDKSLPMSIKRNILLEAKQMMSQKRKIYTTKIQTYIKQLSDKVERVEAHDYSCIKAQKPSIGFYIIISDLLIKELITKYHTTTTHSAVTNYMPDGEEYISKKYSCILTNIGTLNNHALMHSIHYYFDKTIEVDPILECSQAIYKVVNEFGDIETVMDEAKMNLIVEEARKKIKVF